MVTEVTSTTEKRGVVFTFLSELLYNPKILCKFAAEINGKSMNGTVVTPHSPISLRYWEMLKGLSDTVKMELVALLSTSLVNKEEVAESEMTDEEKDREFWSLCGCWKDDPEDAARMEAAIKDGRKYEFMREINLDD